MYIYVCVLHIETGILLQGLALISVRDSWTKNHEWMNKFLLDKNLNVENTIMEQLGMSLLLLFVSPSLTCEYLCFSGLDFNIISLFKVDIVFATLDCMIKAA
jgi:hypothetical protein